MFVSVAQIQAEVAKSFDIPVAKMTEPLNRGLGRDGRNNQKFSFPRQIAMYLAAKLTTQSKNRIGDLFGNRDHSTVIYAVEAVEAAMMGDRKLRRRVEDIEMTILSGDIPAPLVCMVAPTESLDCSMDQEVEQKPHWRERERAERKRLSAVYSELMRPVVYEPKVREEDRVRRDPCIKCGTRADVGCIHTRVAA